MISFFCFVSVLVKDGCGRLFVCSPLVDGLRYRVLQYGFNSEDVFCSNYALCETEFFLWALFWLLRTLQKKTCIVNCFIALPQAQSVFLYSIPLRTDGFNNSNIDLCGK